jgi:hypothetical protein
MLPKQGHGWCQPINDIPQWYIAKHVAIQATNPHWSFMLSPKKQIVDSIISRAPTNNIICRNETPKMGSAMSKISTLPNELIILAKPVIRKIPPAERINRLDHLPNLSPDGSRKSTC